MKNIWRIALFALALVVTLQPFVQAQQANPVDFSGVWWNPTDITCIRFTFVVIENDIVIRESCPPSMPSIGILGTGKLNGRYFTGDINTAPDINGGRRHPGKFGEFHFKVHQMTNS